MGLVTVSADRESFAYAQTEKKSWQTTPRRDTRTCVAKNSARRARVVKQKFEVKNGLL